jgi:hypothetical protein
MTANTKRLATSHGRSRHDWTQWAGHRLMVRRPARAVGLDPVQAGWCQFNAQVPAGDVERWQWLNVSIREAYQAGDYAKGVKRAEEALAFAQGAFSNRALQTLTSLNNLSCIYQDQGRYGEAEPLFREALQVRREVLGPPLAASGPFRRKRSDINWIFDWSDSRAGYVNLAISMTYS